MPTSVASPPRLQSQMSTDDGLKRASPEDHGVSTEAIAAFLTEAGALGVEMHSFMIYRGGDVIAEGWWSPYRPDLRHMMHSATKSFLSTGVGAAIAEGRFGLQDRVASFFKDRLPKGDLGRVGEMTVEDLLTQTTGHAHGVSGNSWRGIQTSWITEFFKIATPYAPGSTFRYSSASSFMLSAIISETTGQNAHDYITPRLLEPMGITDLRWDVGPENINPGGNGVSARTVDLLKLAILHLQGGMWQGRRLLPADWVEAATTPKRGNPYGYHWWAGPGGAFYAYGAFGQFAFVFPEHQAIVVTTAATPWGEETLRSLVWHHFPKMFDGAAAAPGPTAPPWASLRLLPPLTETTSPLAEAVSGQVYEVDPNEDGVLRFGLTFEAGRCLFDLSDAKGDHRIEVGLSDWLEGSTTMSGARLHHAYEPDQLRVVAGGVWLDDHSFEMTWQFVETAFRDRVVIRFSQDGATLDRDVNTNSMTPVRPTIVGRVRP